MVSSCSLFLSFKAILFWLSSFGSNSTSLGVGPSFSPRSNVGLVLTYERPYLRLYYFSRYSTLSESRSRSLVSKSSLAFRALSLSRFFESLPSKDVLSSCETPTVFRSISANRISSLQSKLFFSSFTIRSSLTLSLFLSLTFSASIYS